jgi:dCMP deaminase
MGKFSMSEKKEEKGMSAKWDKRFMSLARDIATWSKDRSTKIGAVLVGPNREIRTTGFNGFPRGVNDDVESRHQRPDKYFFTEHSERNIVYHAARNGISTEGCTIYVCGRPPCADCARAIIQSGIKEVVLETLEHKSRPEIDWERNTKAAMEMLNEAGVKVRLVEE